MAECPEGAERFDSRTDRGVCGKTYRRNMYLCVTVVMKTLDRMRTGCMSLCPSWSLKLFCVVCSPEGGEQDSASASSSTPLRGRSAAGRKHRFDLAARTLLARAGEDRERTF